MRYLFILIGFNVFITLEAQNIGDSIDVLNYHIQLTFDSSSFSKNILRGETFISYQIPSGGKSASFDLLNLTIDSIQFIGPNKGQWKVGKEGFNIQYPHHIFPTDTLGIKVFYKGIPAKDKQWGGFYFYGKEAWNYGVGMEAIPPVYGRAWFPCNDNFTDRALYEFSITVPHGYSAICNGIPMGTKASSNGQMVWNWKLNQNIPTYLASVAVGPYEAIQTEYVNESRNIPVQIFDVSENIQNAKSSFRNLNRWMQIFESRFGPYAWDRVGFVMVPFRGGAMEHACNIAISRVTVDGSLQWEPLYAHELSHHWFGNLVTCAGEKDMWLNEGWASYAECIMMEDLYGIKAFKDYVRQNQFDVLSHTHRKDGGFYAVYGIPHPLTYSSTVYDKGSMVVHNLRGYLGDSLFFMGVRKYLEAYAFNNCSVKEFESFLAQVTNKDLSGFFNFWVYGTGFNSLVLDSVFTQKEGNYYKSNIFLSQFLYGTSQFQNYGEIEILVLGKKNEKLIRRLSFSGEKSSAAIDLPFEPDLFILDPEQRIADGSINQLFTLNEVSDIESQECHFSAHCQSGNDEGILQISYFFADAPQAHLKGSPIRLLSGNFWEVKGRNFEACLSKVKFHIPENQPIKKPVLLYRKDNNCSWEIIPSVYSGALESSQPLTNGFYTIGIQD